MKLCYKGIDVSHWQGTVNFNLVKNTDVGQFVIIKAGGSNCTSDKGYFTYTDPNLETYYKNAKAAGLHIGFYWYTVANSVAEAKAEAQKFIALIKDKKPDFPVYLDMEYESRVLALTVAQRTAIIKAFLEVLEKEKYYTGLYSSANFIKSNLDYEALKSYDMWIAQYSSVCTFSVLPYGMWQYGGSQNKLRSVKVNGVSSAACDQDFCYKDYPSIIKKAGLNGYSSDPVEAPVVTDTSDTISKGDRVKVAVAKTVSKKKYGKTYTNANFILYYDTYTVISVSKDRAVIGVNGIVTAAVNVSTLTKV